MSKTRCAALNCVVRYSRQLAAWEELKGRTHVKDACGSAKRHLKACVGFPFRLYIQAFHATRSRSVDYSEVPSPAPPPAVHGPRWWWCRGPGVLTWCLEMSDEWSGRGQTVVWKLSVRPCSGLKCLKSDTRFHFATLRFFCSPA